MKVLNVIHRFSPAIGGAEIWCENLCSFLVKKGIITKVATMNMYHVAESLFENFKPDEFIKLGQDDYENGVFIKRYELWKSWSISPTAIISKLLLHILGFKKTEIGEIFMHSPHSFQLYKSLFNEIKNSDIVLLYTLPYFHNIVGYCIAKHYKKKIILIPFFHPNHEAYEKNIFFKLMRNCDAIITLSEYEKKHLTQRGIDQEKIHVSGCCIGETQEYSQNEKYDIFKSYMFNEFGIDGNTKKILFIGRKEIYKGFETLISAAKKFSVEEKIDTALFLVGPDTPDFDRIFATLDKPDNLKIINFGAVSEEEKHCLLQFSDLLVLPSKFESFGIVFLDAWKYEKPVIGTNFGVIPEVINGAGLLFEYGNVDDLKNKIKEILCDEKLSRKLGEIGRQKVDKEYSIDRVYGKVFNVIKTLRSNKKKILIVSNLFPPYVIGGADIIPYEHSKRLKNMGFDVRIFAGKIDDFKQRFSIVKKNTEFKITRINLHHRDFVHDTYANFDKEELAGKFRNELYDYSPDIVHFHNIFALSLKMIDDCLKMNIPTAMTMHDYWGICPKNIFLEQNGKICSKKDGRCSGCHGDLLLEKEGSISIEWRNLISKEYYNKVNLLIAPSKYLAERYIERGIIDSKVKVIPNGIDVARFQKIKKTKSSKIRFGYIGQIVWHKGIENLIRAMSFLDEEEREKIFLLLVGGGEGVFVNYCKLLAKDLKFVKFIGRVKNREIEKVLSKIDVLIVPSIWPELLPGTIFEALACGIPVIASDIGGIPELVKDSINGFLYKHDNPLALASIIKDIIKYPHKINVMTNACLTQVSEYDIAKQVRIIAENYHKIYYKL